MNTPTPKRYARYIKIEMSNRTTFTLPREKAEAFLNSPVQMLRITDPDTGEWTGEIINKAHIVDTKPDWGPQNDEIRERSNQIENRLLELSPRLDQEEIKRLQEEKQRLFLGRPETALPYPQDAFAQGGQ